MILMHLILRPTAGGVNARLKPPQLRGGQSPCVPAKNAR